MLLPLSLPSTGAIGPDVSSMLVARCNNFQKNKHGLHIIVIHTPTYTHEHSGMSTPHPAVKLVAVVVIFYVCRVAGGNGWRGPPWSE